jgi:hypothetical protein
LKNLLDYYVNTPHQSAEPTASSQGKALNEYRSDPGYSDSKGLSGSSAYRVTEACSGRVVEGCFVLRPDFDDAAISALRGYIAATPDRDLAEQLDDWISRVIRRKYCVKVRKEEADSG